MQSKSLSKFKLELIDAEYSLVVDKVARLQDKVSYFQLIIVPLAICKYKQMKIKFLIFLTAYIFFFSFICKVRSIEENINMTKMEMENQTEMETELEKRLDQLSERLIQKQSQVEQISCK